MNREQIKAERTKLEEETTDLKYKLDIVRGKLKALQNACKHPDMRSYYCMGEPTSVCPDCGLAT